MAVGDLSPDEQTFAQTLSQLTGLDLTVVTSWIGAESGWGVDKGNHNYLNMRGRVGWANYPSAQAAAQAAAQNLETPLYSGVIASIPQGGAAQIAAIKASPWDAGHYSSGALDSIYATLSGSGADTSQTPTVGPGQAVLTSSVTGPEIGGGPALGVPLLNVPGVTTLGFNISKSELLKAGLLIAGAVLVLMGLALMFRGSKVEGDAEKAGTAAAVAAG